MTKARRVDGADLSHHQASVNLGVAKKAGLKFCYFKSSEGATVVDKTYDSRMTSARGLDLPSGPYHFCSPDGGDAVEEAKWFLRNISMKPGDCLPAIDFEVMGKLKGKAAAVKWANTFSKVVQDSVGFLPVLYGPWNLTPSDDVRWVPRYNNTNTPPDEKGWDIWQFSNGEYGVPNEFAGLGHVDLNTFGKGMNMSRLLIPRQLSSLDVTIWHVSMQFSDNDKQQAADAKKIFKTARKKSVRWITGTEAGPGSNLSEYLRQEADANNYRYFRAVGQDAWVAVAKETIAGNWQQDAGDVVVEGKGGRWTSKSVPVVSYTDEIFGDNAVSASHYLTKGRPGAKPPYNQNVEENTALAEEVGNRAKEYGKGKRKFFYGGDQNIVDRLDDTFFGEPLTSCWDELQRWENTAHGNIDVIASYDGDGKVTCKSAKAFDDSEFKLHTDHWLVEAVYTIQY